MILVADVGATKTALAVAPPGNVRSLAAFERYHTNEWPGLARLVRAYLEKHRLRVEAAFFGVPGPVVGGCVRCTNIPWRIAAGELRDELGVPAVTIMNDLEAAAAALPALQPEDIATIHAGEAAEHGTIGLVAPGTGLGAAFLTWDGARYRAHPSEGGHTDFAPANRLQWELHAYLQERFPHVSYERVCSGSAVPNIYAFLRDTGREREPAGFANRLRREGDPTAAIFEDAKRQDASSICRRTVELFIEILGAKVGNLALTVFATGGMHLAGGIPPRIVPLLRQPRFIDAVHRKGRMSDSLPLQRLAVHVVRRPNLTLVGLAHTAVSARAANPNGQASG